MYCLYFAGTMSVFLPMACVGKGLKVNLLPWQSPMNKYMDCAEYILLIYCLICLFESLCLLAAFDTSDFFVVPVEWKTDKQNTVMPQKCTTRNAEKNKTKQQQ